MKNPGEGVSLFAAVDWCTLTSNIRLEVSFNSPPTQRLRLSKLLSEPSVAGEWLQARLLKYAPENVA